MKFKQLHSGSSGNLYILTASNGKRLMIECGVTKAKLNKALDFDLSGFEGCLVTHQHKDHCKALVNIMDAGIEAYALGDVFLSQDISSHHRAHRIMNNNLLKFDSFQVFVFAVNHDVPSVGFVIHEKETGEKMLFCADTSHITQKFDYPFSIIAIECSFDKEVLQKRVDQYEYKLKHSSFDSKNPLGPIHPSLAKRLWGSHMEKDNTLTYIRDKCNLSKCRELHLLHLSGDNIDKNKTCNYFKNELFIDTFIVGD